MSTHEYVKSIRFARDIETISRQIESINKLDSILRTIICSDYQI